MSVFLVEYERSDVILSSIRERVHRRLLVACSGIFERWAALDE